MKVNRILILGVLLLLAIKGSAQDFKRQVLDTIEVGLLKNTYVKIKSTSVLSLDMGGDENVIFEVDNGVIKMKAVKEKFLETNFLVICQDTLLQFIVKYNVTPKQTIYEYDLNVIKNRQRQALVTKPVKTNSPPIGDSTPPPVVVKEITKGIKKNEKSKPDKKTVLSSNSAEPDFKSLLAKKANISLGEVKEGIKMRLQKMYVDNHYMYFGLTGQNSTPIDYVIDYINFEVRSKSSTLGATGLQSAYPAYKTDENNVSVISATGANTLMYAIEKFAIRADELLLLTLYEKSSSSKGRSYVIKINSKDFSKIKKLN